MGELFTYLIYDGEREGEFSVNSRAVGGAKMRVRRGIPFAIHPGDMWMVNMRGFKVLYTTEHIPPVVRVQGNDLSYCSKYEGAFIEGLASSCPDPARVVEIGTGKGNSLLRLLYGLVLHEDARVWSVDLLECEETRQYVERSGVAPGRYTYLTGPSDEVVDQVDEMLDLVYVDGAHNDKGVRRDIEVWSKLVKVGGVMAFHDYQNPMHEVTQAIDDLMIGQWERVGQAGHVVAFEKARYE